MDIAKAFNKAKEDGIAIGYAKGYAESFAEGYAFGYAKACAEGYIGFFAEGYAIGYVEGIAEEKGNSILKYFPPIFNDAVPAKLQQLIKKLQNKRDLKNLEKLQDFLFLRKGSKDDFLRYAESLEA